MQLMGKAVELAHNAFVTPMQCVVSQHCGDRHRETEGGHDQRLPYRPGDLVDARLAGGADPHQRVINAPYRAKQPEKWRGGTHRCEYRQTALEALVTLIYRPAQACGQPVAERQMAV